MISKSSYYKYETGVDNERKIRTVVEYYDRDSNILNKYKFDGYPNVVELKNKLDPFYKPRPTKIKISFAISSNCANFYNKNGKMFYIPYNGEKTFDSLIYNLKTEIDYEWCLRNKNIIEFEVYEENCILM